MTAGRRALRRKRSRLDDASGDDGIALSGRLGGDWKERPEEIGVDPAATGLSIAWSRRASPADLLASFTATRPTVAERRASGKALRRAVPRGSHSQFAPAADRPDPVEIPTPESDPGEEAGAGALCAHARLALRLPARLGRGDDGRSGGDSGDRRAGQCLRRHARLEFRRVRLGRARTRLRDQRFRRGVPAPWEWDLKRLAASAAVAVRFMGGDKPSAAESAAAIVASYREHVSRYAEMGHLRYGTIVSTSVPCSMPLSPKVRRGPNAPSTRRAKGHQRVLDKITEEIEGEHRIVEERPLIVRETHIDTGTPIDQALDGMLRSYIESLTFDRRRLLARYRIVDVARKVVGVGSVGTGCWVVLLRASTATIRCSCRSRRRRPRCWSLTPTSACRSTITAVGWWWASA